MNVHDLSPGVRVRIKKAFRDFDRCEHAAETVLVFTSQEHFAYDGGYTLRFEDGTVIRLAEIEPTCAAVLFDTKDEYWEIVAD